jgi:hypothetical protein
MSPIYPYDLVFNLASGTHRVAVEAAAAALQLPLHADGETIVRVTVSAPDQAYRFGQKTGELLNGETAPMPKRTVPKS